MSTPPRKPQRLCDRVVKFPKIVECDNIELDSLEASSNTSDPNNLLSVLPATLWDLKFLNILKVANNRLALPPDKIADMRTLVLSWRIKNLWDVMTPENAIREVSLQRNVILAAKRLQDLAQSYGAEENLSIIVVKFNLMSSDVDLLMRELRQTIRKNKYQSESGNSNTSCQPGCCCEALNNECMNCIEKIPIPPPMMMCDDRSSPSGQSEHACSDCNSSAKLFINQLNKQNENRSVRSVTPSIFETVEVKASPERRSYRGVAKALRNRREDDKNRDDSDSALSEEQFKCWEYMLEQNTQLLFDKELNTLNRGMRGKPAFSMKTPSLSRSSPHLADISSSPTGTARSFNPALTRSSSRFGLDKKQLVGGPHAAYFGSLQRLMPYNLEYDFAVMHERGLADSLDLDRMQQYWGVTTTEL
ncbi:hypothetical protein NQ317_001100 [Molorchus minor]|uniref:Uncharacterized protein n=1 Tax=Molorchus minor TaxID=1323400 RepID=A0ABQ9J1B6_9CUCU|nr:hypothetical protein NQ317_001100 [Molorchus minor]